jgi:hypothetical protein
VTPITTYLNRTQALRERYAELQERINDAWERCDDISRFDPGDLVSQRSDEIEDAVDELASGTIGFEEFMKRVNASLEEYLVGLNELIDTQKGT